MHEDVLTEQGKKIFRSLTHFPDGYLAGGTALALQIGHRQSIDFDLFFSQPIPQEQASRVKTAFPHSSIAILVNNPDELTALIDGIKITFLSYPFPVILPLVEYEHLHLLSIRELAATKAYTIGRRGSYKDYIDLYYVLAQQRMSLADIIELAQQKYAGEFNARLFLEQLIYLGDINDTEILFLQERIDKERVQLFFEQAIRNFSLQG